MHFMPDTEEEDFEAETYWPESYKRIIREDVHQLLCAQLGKGNRLRHVYEQQYSPSYPDLNQFTNRIAGVLVIGAENGTDDAFDGVISSFLTESPLPKAQSYARYLWPQVFSTEIQRKLQQSVVDEYSQDNVYLYAYLVGYRGSFPEFEQFIDYISHLVVTGAMNGADDMLERIYNSFMISSPLPPARRHPRRLRSW